MYYVIFSTECIYYVFIDVTFPILTFFFKSLIDKIDLYHNEDERCGYSRLLKMAIFLSI